MNVANFISLARVAAAPCIGGFILNEQYAIAAAGIAAAGFSDLLDGYVARKFRQETKLGSVLDPLADKVVINVAAGSLSVKSMLPVEVSGIFLARDSLLLLGAAYFALRLYREQRNRNSTNELPDVSKAGNWFPYRVAPFFLSKVNTAGQFCTVWYASLIGATDLDTDDPALRTLCWIVGSTTALSGMLYARAAWTAPTGLASSVFRKV
jgi:cardiolipin synthase